MNTLTHGLTEIVVAGGEQGPWMDGGGPPFPFFLIPLFWLLVVIAVVLTVVLGRRRREIAAGRRAGERRLAERYAEGAIDEDEFRARRAVLREK
ncbi:SHOCT domain-containing protein [Brachybacterium sacelli]|uniref:Membrane protein n=1 Tax=Brachybacterium sacelli TaxID=173364 RepID=A0ABS4WXM6_9MICO|nr:SHOCT domain-containing protein [Brachybacterium sacelli]MBP2380959.1 putative membrane protein [Brachybacterium sacelli]